ADPVAHPSAGVFFERVPADVARQHQIAGIASDGRTLTVVTSQPMQPAVFASIERLVGMPIQITLSPRAQVVNLINRGYEQKQDLVTEIVEDIPLDEKALQTAAGS